MAGRSKISRVVRRWRRASGMALGLSDGSDRGSVLQGDAWARIILSELEIPSSKTARNCGILRSLRFPTELSVPKRFRSY